MKKKSVKRGEIYWLLSNDSESSARAKDRPCVIIQNDIINQFRIATVVVVTTTKMKEKRYPWDVIIEPPSCGLKEPSRIMCNTIHTVTLDELGKRIGVLSPDKMKELDKALKSGLGIK